MHFVERTDWAFYDVRQMEHVENPTLRRESY
jgi:hypothetical protein